SASPSISSRLSVTRSASRRSANTCCGALSASAWNQCVLSLRNGVAVRKRPTRAGVSRRASRSARQSSASARVCAAERKSGTTHQPSSASALAMSWNGVGGVFMDRQCNDAPYQRWRNGSSSDDSPLWSSSSISASNRPSSPFGKPLRANHARYAPGKSAISRPWYLPYGMRTLTSFGRSSGSIVVASPASLREQPRAIRERLELQRIAAGIEQEHRGLLAGLALEADMRL